MSVAGASVVGVMDSTRRASARHHLSVLGWRVRELRERAGLTQEDLAHRAGLHRAVVGFIERGERDIGVTILWPLAEGLGVSVADLFRPDKPGNSNGSDLYPT